MSETSYDLRVHQSVHDELQRLPDSEAETLRDRLRELPTHREPTELPWAKSLNEHPDLLRVRVTDYRAICAFRKPAVFVLLVGEREGIYDRLDVAQERLRRCLD